MRHWEPFRLFAEPVPPWLEDHVSKCQPCLYRRHWTAVAMHEATHLAVATEIGLKVHYCSIDDTKEVELSELEVRLYPMLPVGTRVPAVLTKLDDGELDRAPKRTLVAMVAPSCIETGDDQIDTYAALEATIGVRMAKSLGLDSDQILDWAKREVERYEADIIRYAERLAWEGRIEVTRQPDQLSDAWHELADE